MATRARCALCCVPDSKAQTYKQQRRRATAACRAVSCMRGSERFVLAGIPMHDTRNCMGARWQRRERTRVRTALLRVHAALR